MSAPTGVSRPAPRLVPVLQRSATRSAAFINELELPVTISGTF